MAKAMPLSKACSREARVRACGSKVRAARGFIVRAEARTYKANTEILRDAQDDGGEQTKAKTRAKARNKQRQNRCRFLGSASLTRCNARNDAGWVYG